MKKILSLFFATMLLHSTVRSQCSSAFFDSFESGNYIPTWTLGTGLTSANVNTVNPAVGMYKVQATGGVSAHLTGLSATFTPASPDYISWYINPSGAVSTNYFVSGDNTVTANNCLVFSYWQGSTNTIRFVNNSVNVGYAATAGTWYQIELKNINYSAKTFDIYVNGVLYQTGFAFRSTTLTSVSNAHLYNFNSGTANWDHIQVGGLNVLTNGTNASCFGNCNGSATVTPSGLAGPYSYTWTPTGSSSNTATGLCAGIYTVLVNTGSCTVSQTLMISQPAPLTTSVSANNVACNGGSSGSATISASGGTGPYSYSWTPPVSGTNTASNLNAGSYTVVVSSSSCVTSTVLNITQPASISIAASQTNVNCLNSTGSAQYTVSGGTAPYTYSWAPVTSPTNSATGLNPGTYSSTATDANGCYQTVTFTITSSTSAPVLATASSASVLCSGQSATLSATGAATYTWNTGANTSAIVISPTVTTTYSVTGQGSNGCISTNTITQSVSLCTGLSAETTVSAPVIIYPNPANANVFIEASFSGTATLLSIEGKLLMQIEVKTGINQLNIAQVPAGVYLIQLRNGRQTKNYKLVIQ